MPAKAQTEEVVKKYLYRFLTGNTIGLTEQNFRLGDNMYADVNNDGKLDQNDIVYLGTNSPKIFLFCVGAENGRDLIYHWFSRVLLNVQSSVREIIMVMRFGVYR